MQIQVSRRADKVPAQFSIRLSRRIKDFITVKEMLSFYRRIGTNEVYAVRYDGTIGVPHTFDDSKQIGEITTDEAAMVWVATGPYFLGKVSKRGLIQQYDPHFRDQVTGILEKLRDFYDRYPVEDGRKLKLHNLA